MVWPFTRKTVAVEEKSTLSDPESWLLEMFGSTPTNSGVSIGPESALRVPAVSAAVRAISEAAATLDIHVVQREGEINRQVPDHPVARLLSGHVNQWTPACQLIRDLTADALLSDAGGLAWVNRLGDGRPAEIIHPPRGSMFVQHDSLTREPSYQLQGRAVPMGDVVHVTSPFGRSPVSLARESIAVALVLERHAARLFGRGARPSGALMFPKGMGEESVKRARTAWQTTHEGDNATGRTAILFDGAEFVPFQLNSTDSQFLENRRFQILEIARAFRVPPQMLFELERATWSNAEQMGREFLTYSLEPWLRALEGALTQALFSEDEREIYRIHFDRDDLTRANLNDRATAINSLIASRVLNPNEGRAWLDLAPRDGGEVFANPNTGNVQPERTGGAADGL